MSETSHVRNPMNMARRILRSRQTTDPEDRIHALLFEVEIRAKCGDDIRQLSAAAHVVIMHAEALKVNRLLLAATPGTPEYDRLLVESVKLTRHEASLLRLCGFTRGPLKAKVSSGDGSVFTAPRGLMPSELRASVTDPAVDAA